MTDQLAISVGLSGFVDFVAAGSGQRIGVVQDVVDMYGSVYDPSHDFYKGTRDALREGIALGDDVQRLRRAVQDANPRRRHNYTAVADGWEPWRGRKNLEPFVQPGRWREQELEVRASPMFTWPQRRRRDLVWVYWKSAALSDEAAQAATRILEHTFTPDLGSPAVLDIRRGRLHQARSRRRRGYDAWLEGEVSAFLRMYNSIRNAA